MAHVAQYKKDIVSRFTKDIESYPIIGVVDMENLPTKTLQIMRAQLRGKADIKMTKKRLMKLAFDQAKVKRAGVDKLVGYMTGMPALIFTKENPFLLYKNLKKNKSKAPAKAGQIAPMDITVQAGPTTFAPGPIIGELGSIGIKTGIEGGKVAIKSDSLVVKEGQIISAKVAGLLTRLGIEPMEIGLNVTAVYEDGTIFDRKVLDIDEDVFLANLKLGASEAFNLAFSSGFPTATTIKLMVQRAFANTKALAIHAGVLAKGIEGDVLARAEMQATALKAKLGV